MTLPASAVPLHLEHNRPFVDLEFARRDGSARVARCWLDTGGGGFLLAEPLAADLGLEPTGAEFEGEGARFAPVLPPAARLGGASLDLEGTRALVLVGRQRVDPAHDAEAFLPGHVLMRHRPVFDYPARLLSLAPPHAPPRGTPVASSVHPDSGFPRVELEIDGERHGFLLDTGAAYTMVSAALLERWAARQPGRPRATGAVGAANMVGNEMEVSASMLRLPEITWGPFRLGDVGVVSRPEGTFERWMSPMMTAPIVGALAGNVLKRFRLEIDYVHGLTYLEAGPTPDPRDLDLVGLTLRPEADGGFTVVAVSEYNAFHTLEGVRVGDRLLAVDGLELTGLSLGRAVDSLRGRPGEERRLGLEREGAQFEVGAPVVRVL